MPDGKAEKDIVDLRSEHMKILSHLFVESIEDIITILDLDHRILVANKAAYRLARLFGRIPVKEDIIGKPCHQVFLGSSKVCEDCEFTEVLQKRARVIHDRYDEKGKRWYKYMVYPIFQGDEIIAIGQIARDITEEKRLESTVEEEQRLSEKRYKDIIERSNDAIVIIQDGRNVYNNAKSREMFGYSKEEIQDHPFTHFIANEDEAKKIWQRYQDRMEGKDVPSMYETNVCRKDGSITDVEVNVGLVEWKGRPAVMVTVRDITNRKQTEKELLVKSTLLEAQSETTLDGILVVNEEGKSVLFNKRFGEMWNIPQEILDTKDDDKMIKKVLDQLEDPDQFVEKVRYLYAHPEEKSVDELNFKDGRVFERFSSPLIDSNGTHYGRIWFFHDSTARKQSERALQESEKRYRIFVENYKGIAFQGNPPLKPNFIHGAVEDITGYTEEELLTGTVRIRDMIFPDDMANFLKNIEPVRKTPGRAAEFEYRIIRKDGQIRWVRQFIQNISDQIEKTLSQGIIEDITERREADRKIRESEEQYRTTIESLGDPLHVVDKDLRIILINRSYQDWLHKLDLDPVSPGQTLKEGFPFFPPKILTEYEYVFETGKSLITIEEESFIPGIELSLEVRKIPIIGEGKVIQVITIIHDITEREIAQRKLKESEELYKTLMKTSPDAVSVADLNGKGILTSQRARELFGYGPDEDLSEIEILDHFFPEEYDKITKNTEKALKEGYVGPIEYKMKRRDGTAFIGELNASLLKDADGKPKGFIASYRDITERKRVEQKLRESDSRFRHLFEKSPMAIILTDLTGEIKDCNSACSQVLGYEKEDLHGTNFLHLQKIVLPRFLPDIEKSYQILLKQKETEKIEFQIRDKEGRLIWMLMKASLIKLGDQARIYILIQNINDWKIAESRLRESLEKYELLTTHVNDVIVLVNPKSGIEFINEKPLLQITGFTSEDLMGELGLELVHPDDRDLALNKLNATFKDGEGHGEGRIFKKDGTPLWLEVKGKAFIDYQGNPKAIFIARDIEKRKQMEEKLRVSEERYRTLVESSPNSIFLLDMTGKVIDCNKITKQNFGYQKDELVGKDFRELTFFFKPDYYPLLVMKFQNFIADGVTDPITLEVTKKDGSKGWVVADASIVHLGEETIIQVIAQDITKSRRAELQIEESREKYRLLTEHAHDLITIIDNNGKIEFINELPHADILGYLKEDLIGKSAIELVHPDDAKEILKAAEDLRKRGEGQEEFRLKKNDGTYLWIEVKGKIFVDQNGETKSILISRDITGRKNAEDEREKLLEQIQLQNEELNRSREEFKKIIDESSDSIGIIQDGRIAYANQNALNHSGYTLEEIKNLPFIKFAANKTEEKMMVQRYQDRMEGKELSPLVETRLRRKDGTIVNAEISGTSIQWEGKPATFMILRDITERKQMERELKETKEKYEKILNILPDIFFLVKGDSTILEFMGDEKQLYLPPEKIINEKVTEFHPGKIGEDAFNSIQKALETKKPQFFEYTYPFKGKDHTFEAVYLYFAEDRVGVFIRDITKRR